MSAAVGGRLSSGPVLSATVAISRSRVALGGWVNDASDVAGRGDAVLGPPQLAVGEGLVTS